MLLQNTYRHPPIHSHVHEAPSAPSGVIARLVQPLVIRVRWNAVLYYSSGSISQYTVYATPLIVPEQKRMTDPSVIEKVSKVTERLFEKCT